MDRQTIYEIHEKAACVQINFENLKKTMPMLQLHPLLKVFEFQLDDLIQSIESELAYENKKTGTSNPG